MVKKPSDSDLDSELAAAIATALNPAKLSAEQRELLRARILRRVRAPAPERTYTIRADEGEWIRVGPLAEIKVLRRDWQANNQSLLVRLAPGAVMRTHNHLQEEECLVLEGEARIGEHVFREGDVHVALPGAVHDGLRTSTGCLLYIRSEIPADLSRPNQPGGS